MATDPQPALPPIIASNLSSVARLALAVAGMWLVNHGVLTTDQDTQFISVGAGLAVGAGSLAWSWWRNRSVAKKLVAAAATGNPTADPKDPSTIRAVTKAIANIYSPINAKETP